MRLLSRKLRAILMAGLLLVIAFTPWPSNRATAQDQKPFELSAILSLTGALTFTGRGAQQAIQIIQGIVNSSGGIQHHPLNVTFFDDQSNPAVAVQLLNGVIAKGQAAVLGPILTSNCEAVAAIAKESGPVSYCLSSAYTPTKGGFAFAAAGGSLGNSEVMLRYFSSRHWNKIAILETTDATGQSIGDGYTLSLTRPENAGITIVAKERMGVTDININAQLLRIKAAHPDVLLLAMSGAPGGTAKRLDPRDMIFSSVKA